MRLDYIDSHTEGEPTRLIFGGFPELKGDSFAAKAESLTRDWNHLRRAIVVEPRAYEAVVGALLVPSETADAGIIFFNNVGVLGMCGHGTIGVTVCFAESGLPVKETYTIETNVGTVQSRLISNNKVQISNVESRLFKSEVVVDVDGFGPIRGDIAYGGNWFFLTHDTCAPMLQENKDALWEQAKAIRKHLDDNGITGENGGQIDHIELLGEDHEGQHVNFVLCPGGEYDRSPCGTGTSAHVACLAERNELLPGEIWEQHSIFGGKFEAVVTVGENGGWLPQITGSAFMTAKGQLIFDTHDPLCWGLGS